MEGKLQKFTAHIIPILIDVGIALIIVFIVFWIRGLFKKQQDAQRKQAEDFEQSLLSTFKKKALLVQPAGGKKPDMAIGGSETSQSPSSTADVTPQPNPVNAVIEKLSAANLFVASEGHLMELGKVDRGTTVVKLPHNKSALIITYFPDEHRTASLLKRFDALFVTEDGETIYTMQRFSSYIVQKLAL